MARNKWQQHYSFVLGMFFSFSLSMWMCQYIDVSRHLGCYSRSNFRANSRGAAESRFQYFGQVMNGKGFLFIAIMTSTKYMETRARGVWDTWGKNFSGKLVFFIGQTNETVSWNDMPVIALDVEDNVYPPQKKSLTMLKYVYEHFVDEYRWFIRADDDVYMKTDRLIAYLKRFDSSEDLVLGQPGIGKKEELGILGLGANDNFCMGGPGVIMTSGVLRKMGPHTTYCINSTASFHEDVEVGRCIRRFGGAICPWSYEMKEMFRQVYEKPFEAYHGPLDTMDIEKAITLHPVKDPAYMRRMHVHFLKSRVMELNGRRSILEKALKKMQLITNEQYQKSSVFNDPVDNSINPWEMLDLTKIWALTDKPPLRYIHDGTKDAMNRIVGFARELVTREGDDSPPHNIDINKWHTGYMRVRATKAIEFQFSLPVKYQRQLDGKMKIIRTRRSVQLHQNFTKLIPGDIRTVMEFKRTLHFIVPLMGRLKNFKRFLASFEKEFFIPKEPVKLLVVYFPEAEPLTGQRIEYVKYAKKYPAVEMKWLDVKGPFKRAVALQLGTDYYAPDSLLYFCDVDLVFRREFADRCRVNAEIGKRAYFPVMFSQFNPKITWAVKKPPPSHFHYSKEAGFWRWYSFGPVCAFAKDISDSGGLNTDLAGWGLEDVDLYEKFLKRTDIEIYRAPDPGLVHVYHAHAPCDPQSTEEQQTMCWAAQADLFSNAASAVDFIHSRGYLDFLSS